MRYYAVFGEYTSKCCRIVLAIGICVFWMALMGECKAVSTNILFGGYWYDIGTNSSGQHLYAQYLTSTNTITWSDPYTNWLAMAWNADTNVYGREIDYSPSGGNTGTLSSLTSANRIVIGTNLNGRVKYAWNMSGATDYISTASTNFTDGCTALTIMVSMNLNAYVAFGGMLCCRNAGGTYQLLYSSSGSGITTQFTYQASTDVLQGQPGSLPTGQWINVALTWCTNGFQTSYYTNGILVKSGPGHKTPVVQNVPMYWGTDPSGQNINSQFAWCRVYTNLYMSSNAVYNASQNKLMPNGDYENYITNANLSPLYYTNIIFRYSFDSDTGTNYTDSGNNNYTAYAYNGTLPVWTNGVILFSSNSFIRIPTNASVHGLTQATHSYWIKLTGNLVDYNWIIGECTPSYGYARFASVLNSTRNPVIFWRDSASDPTGSAGSHVSTGVLSTNQWIHVVSIYDSVTDEESVYTNGVFVSKGTTAVSAFATTAPSSVLIGALENNVGTYVYHMRGYLDNVACYNRALTSNEVFNLYTREQTEIRP